MRAKITFLHFYAIDERGMKRGGEKNPQKYQRGRLAAEINSKQFRQKLQLLST